MVCVCMCAQLCLTLCDPMDCNPPDSSVHAISQANTGVGCHFLLQGILQPRDCTSVSCASRIGRQILYHGCHLGSLDYEEGYTIQ